MDNEFYPIAIHYNDAEVAPGRNPNSMAMNGCKMEMIHGVYKISDTELLEVALQYAQYPSFCGGYYAHSPVSQTLGESSWNEMFGRGTFEMCTSVKDIHENVIDLREHGVSFETTKGWELYGYRVLANSLFSKMVGMGKRGVVFSGPVHSPVTNFLRQAENLTRVRKCYAPFSKLKWAPEAACYIDTVVEADLEVVVQDTEPFVNFNSGNLCRWLPVVITTPLLGGEEGEDDDDAARDRAWEDYEAGGRSENEYFEDWYGERMYEYRYGDDVVVGEALQEEVDYAAIALRYARRYTWCN